MHNISKFGVIYKLALLIFFVLVIAIEPRLPDQRAPPLCKVSEFGWLEIEVSGTPGLVGVIEIQANNSRCRLEVTAGQTYRVDIGALHATIYSLAKPQILGVIYAVPTVKDVAIEKPKVVITLERYEWLAHIFTALAIVIPVLIWLLKPPRQDYSRYWMPYEIVRVQKVVSIIAFLLIVWVFYFVFEQLHNYVWFIYGSNLFFITVSIFLIAYLIMDLVREIKMAMYNKAKMRLKAVWSYFAVIYWIPYSILAYVFLAAFYSFSSAVLDFLQIRPPQEGIFTSTSWKQTPFYIIVMFLFATLLLLLGRWDPEWIKAFFSPFAAKEIAVIHYINHYATWDLIFVRRGKNEVLLLGAEPDCLRILSPTAGETCYQKLSSVRFQKIDLWNGYEIIKPVEIRVIYNANFKSRWPYVTKVFIRGQKCTARSDSGIIYAKRDGRYAIVTALGRHVEVECEQVENFPVSDSIEISGRSWENPYMRVLAVGAFSHGYGFAPSIRLKSQRAGKDGRGLRLTIEYLTTVT